MQRSPNYYIEYTDGTVKYFYAGSDSSAHNYFMMEGDHAYDYGPLKGSKHEQSVD